jgi:hypothetical protein
MVKEVGLAKRTCLDDRNHIARRVLELAHIDGEVLQLVRLRFLEDQLGALSNCIDAAQICNGVKGWVRGPGKRYFGDGDGHLGAICWLWEGRF